MFICESRFCNYVMTCYDLFFLGLEYYVMLVLVLVLGLVLGLVLVLVLVLFL